MVACVGGVVVYDCVVMVWRRVLMGWWCGDCVMMVWWCVVIVWWLCGKGRLVVWRWYDGGVMVWWLCGGCVVVVW